MTIKYRLQFFFFFELTDKDSQHFLAGIIPTFRLIIRSLKMLATLSHSYSVELLHPVGSNLHHHAVPQKIPKATY
jgi:hypothetical protein